MKKRLDMSLDNMIHVEKESVMSKTEGLAYSMLVAISFFFLARYAFWWFDPSHIANNWHSFPLHLVDIFLFVILSFIVFLGGLLRIGNWFALWHMARPRSYAPEKGLRVAFLTCFVPGKEPYDMLEKTLASMVAATYPHDTWVLDEGNDETVKEMCKRLGVQHFSRLGVTKYNQAKGLYRVKTKAGNHNAWRDIHEDAYDIVAQIDMDHVPSPNYFEKTLGYFRDPKVGFVGMPQVYSNLTNWIAKGAAEQAYFFHGPIQKGYYGCDMPFLIGTSHIYRVLAMKDIGGYAPTIVEDHLTGMHFYAKGYKGVFVPEILAQGEGPRNWVDYFNQQMRWSYGLFEILFKHTPALFHRFSWQQKVNYLLAQLYYFTGVAVILGMALAFFYLVFGVRSASMDLSEWLSHAAPPFFLSYVLQLYAHRFSIDHEKEPVVGLLGMFLGLGANIIYALAFCKFIMRRNLRYMVTKKGSSAFLYRVPLGTFMYHILLAAAMLFSFVVSLYTGHDAVQLRFWALFNITTLLMVALSIYWERIGVYTKLLSPSPLLRVGYRFSLATAVVVLVIIMFTQTAQITEAFENVRNQWMERDVIQFEKSISGTIAPPSKGAYLGISFYERGDKESLLELGQVSKKQFAIVGYYQSWHVDDNVFDAKWAKYLASKGAVPLITWEPWKPSPGYNRVLTDNDVSDYRLQDIIDGRYDPFVEEYAKAVKSFKGPVMIRFAHEMNGNWYPWGSAFNTPQDYIATWRHVHDIFSRVGATNVTWVWSPNEVYEENKIPYANDIDAFYPGDSYVDWVGFSAFNWAGRYKQTIFRYPESLFTPTILQLRKYNKPIIIAETASAEMAGNPNLKAQWILELADYATTHEEVKGIVWFNSQDQDIDWSITSSNSAKAAFKEAFQDNYFVASVSSQ